MDQFELFASLSATIGNQFPCPEYFNTERSNYGNHEFPDLFLRAVYDYKCQKNRIELKKLFAGIEDKKYYDKKEQKYVEEINRSIDFCSDWVEKFGNEWDDFVEKNFFQDFVEYDYVKDCYGEPKVLWKIRGKDHSFEKETLTLPEIGISFVEYLGTINMGIILRGKRIEEKAKQNIKKFLDAKKKNSV